MRDHFGERCLDPIRAAMKIKEAPSQGQTIFEYAAGSHPADDYLRVVDRVIGEPSEPAFDHATSTQLETISA
jgi:chromosome partitioning protein